MKLQKIQALENYKELKLIVHKHTSNMPQVFQVLCCFSCEMFQVHQVKKSNKWQCRVCNQKQSLKKAFKIGSTRDCRLLVQELNMRKSGHVQEDVEELEKWEDCEDTVKDESKTPEILDYTEVFQVCSDEENFADDYVRSNENSDWLKDSIRDDHRIFSDSLHELQEENPAASTNNYVLQSSIGNESSCDIPKSCDSMSDLCENVEQSKIGSDENTNFKKLQKRSLETNVDVSSQNVASPPLKKNRGFQLILNAASKLK